MTGHGQSLLKTEGLEKDLQLVTKLLGNPQGDDRSWAELNEDKGAGEDLQLDTKPLGNPQGYDRT